MLIKKLFPPKESVFTVDTDGNRRADSLQIKFLNLIIPFVIPKEIEIGDFKLKEFDLENFDISQHGKFFLDDTPLDFTKESFNLDNISNRLLIYYKGVSYSVNDILHGKLSGKTIDLGDTISILVKIDEGTLKKFTEGNHIFRVESDFITNLEIFFELDGTNMNIKFNPENA
ncbi:MAG: hypothetical protein ACFE9C_14865 [Candidatus Hodarchaeota archaeon]